MLQLCWRIWLCLQTRSPSQEIWWPPPLDPRLSSWVLLCLWTWPWRRRWQVSGSRFPVWTSWAAVTTQMPVMFWTSWFLLVRTVLNRCTPMDCPATAPSKPARTLCPSPTSTCPTWICRTGWRTGTTGCRACWGARARSWAASKSPSHFTPTKMSRWFAIFVHLHLKKLGNERRSCTKFRVWRWNSQVSMPDDNEKKDEMEDFTR